MNKLFTKVAALSVGLAMAIGVGVGLGSKAPVRAKASEEVAYTLSGTTTGSGNSYNGTGTTTQSNVLWNINGNLTTNPWRIGGNKNNGLSSAGTVRIVQSQAAVSNRNITKVVVATSKPSSNSINPTNVSLKVGTSAGGSQTSSLSNGSWAASVTFNRPSGADWSSKYFEIDFTMPANNTTTNKFIEFTSATFYYEAGSTPVAVTSVTVSPNSETVKVGKTKTLSATILPNDATTNTATWLTSDSSVATVADGVVTGVAAGSATITAFADENSNGTLDAGEKSGTCAVTVQAIQTISVSVADALTAAAALSNNETSDDLYAVTGYVTNVSYAWITSDGTTFDLADTKGGSPTINAFKIKPTEAIGEKVLNDAKLIVTGNLKNYNNGTYEIVNNTDVATPITVLEEGTGYAEPSTINTDLAGFVAASTVDKEQKYHFSAEVKTVAGDKYGNMTLTDGTTDLVVYGSTATSSALKWRAATGKYDFKNPQDFDTDPLTSTIAVGDTVEVDFIRQVYSGTIQGMGIILNVTRIPTITLSSATLSLTAGGTTGSLTATKTNDGGATVTWNSDDPTVATVSGNGDSATVTPVAAGTCNVTASITVSSTTYTATCAVTVSAAQDITGSYVVVSSLSQLTNGAIVVIANADGDYALSTNQQSNNRAGTASGISSGTITISDNSTSIQAFSIESYNSGTDTIVAFKTINGTEQGYIYASSGSANQLKTQATLNDNGKFLIDLTSNVFTFTAQGTNSRNTLRFNPNNGSPIFACYATGSTTGTAAAIYIKSSSIDPTVVASVTLDKNTDTVQVGLTTTLTATISPNTATTQTATWFSDDTTVATVSSGVVTGVAAGSATITAYADENENEQLDANEKYATCLITVVAASASGTYQKVTSSSEIEDGQYLIVYETASVALNGGLSTLDAVSNTISVSITNNEIEKTAATQAAEFTIDVSEGSLLSASGKYAGVSSYSNGLDSSDTLIENSFDIDENENALITVSTAGGTMTMKYNDTSGQTRFRYYKSGQKDIQLYKFVESYTAADFATEFLSTLSTGQSHICAADGSTNFANLKAAWKTFAGKWTNVSDKTTITGATPSESGDNYQKTLALYKYIAEKYNTQLQDSELTNYNFMGITVNPRSSARIAIFGQNGVDTDTTLIIVIASVVAVAAVGGYFFLRRKKEQ